MIDLEGSSLPGKFKAWLFQLGLLSRLIWPLMMYEVPMTSVEGIKRHLNKHVCRWFRTLDNYSYPLSSVEEFKVSKWRAVMMFRHASDERIRGACITTQSGCKWAADLSAAQAKRALKDIIENRCTGRRGLGTIHLQQMGKADPRQFLPPTFLHFWHYYRYL